MEQSFPKRPFRTHGGAHVPHHKNTAHTETHVMPPPDEITLPMTQHIGFGVRFQVGAQRFKYAAHSAASSL